MSWHRMKNAHDGGGERDFLDDKPIHCGSGLELQAHEWYTDKEGQEHIRKLDRGIAVRYEVTRVNRFVRDYVKCRHCDGTGKPCGKGKDCDAYECGESCSFCNGKGDMANQIVTREPQGQMRWVRVPMIHVVVGGHEFSAPVDSWMMFRWPSR